MAAPFLLLLALVYCSWTLVCLEANVRKARSLQVRVIRIPFSANSNIWVIFQPLVWAVLDFCVPIEWSFYPDFIRFSHRNWHFIEKSHPISHFGSVWAIASPSGISLHVANAEAIVDIFSRWKDFLRPNHKYSMLAFYGPSIFTADLDDWPRHRKAVAAPFTEGLMKSVWEESVRQTEGMMQRWTGDGSEVPSLEGDLRALTFNVLAATATQKPHSSKGCSAQTCDCEKTTAAYRDTLHIVLENAILLMLIPYRHLTKSLVPNGLSRIGRAASSFKSMIMDTVAEEMAAFDRVGAAPDGLLSPLVRSVKRQSAAPGRPCSGEDVANRAKRGGLSADEILGNVFAINFAGHDTLLIALSFTLTLLAAHTSIQEWLHEEIVAVIGECSQDRVDWNYNAFPRFHRCHAVLLETLRLYPPITGVPKVASTRATSLRIEDRLISIPPGIEVFPVLLGIQTDARYWGPQPHEWRPSRWILHPGAPAGEEVLEPQKGVFFPWSDGPQNCVGKKFSMVEAVAVLVRLFQGHLLHLERGNGETETQARKRAIDCTNDVNYNLLLRMNHPERVKMKCIRRGDAGENGRRERATGGIRIRQP